MERVGWMESRHRIVAMVVVEETPPGTNGWMTWRDILHLLDVICCCAICFATPSAAAACSVSTAGSSTDGRRDELFFTFGRGGSCKAGFFVAVTARSLQISA